ncbi:MAG: hypothetical protein PVH62_08370, partial [Anaerolineae bacterium]
MWKDRVRTWLLRTWRRLLGQWSFSLLMFFGALPLLTLWITVAALLFCVAVSFLGRFGVLQDEKVVTALAGALIAGLIGFAVQQWKTVDEVDKERREQRQTALQEIDELREVLREREYERAISMYFAFRQKWVLGHRRGLGLEGELQRTWREVSPAPLRVWVELLEERRELKDIKPKDIRECIEGLDWGLRLDAEHTEEVERYLDELISEHRICEVLRALRDDSGGLLLLRRPAIERWLDGLEQKDLDEEATGCLNSLRTLRQQPVRLPGPWQVERPTDPPDTADALKRLGLSCNPFGPAQAELDPWLEKYGVWPQSLGRLSGPRPALVFGPLGGGKTGAALMLMRDCILPAGNPKEDAFPVRVEFGGDLWPRTRSAWLDALAQAWAETLLRVGSLDPYALFEQDSATAASIAHLLFR